MTLVLATETNPGDANWIDSELIAGSGDTPVLIIDLPTGGAAPSIDSEGYRNLCYIVGAGETGTVTLPTITGTLPTLWRISIQTDFDIPGSLEISAEVGQNISYDAVPAVTIVLDGQKTITLVHDENITWAAFPGAVI
jgi:hypothetical protein